MFWSVEIFKQRLKTPGQQCLIEIKGPFNSASALRPNVSD